MNATRYSFKEIKAMMTRKAEGNGKVLSCHLEVWNDKPARLVYLMETPKRLIAGEVVETETREVTSVL